MDASSTQFSRDAQTSIETSQGKHASGHDASLRDAPTDDCRFRRAAVLPDHLVPAARPAPPNAAILITGASGFLGGHLLRALLVRTSAPIICLVRGDEAAARAQLITRLGTFDEATLARRISVIRGSVTEPHFAMQAEAFFDLAERVAVVFHLAAKLDFRGSFDDLRTVNVDGVSQVLSFGAAGLAKRIVYVSSLSVLETAAYYGQTVTESTRLAHPELLPLGYSQTKWAAEAMLAAAQARGFDVLRLRPSWIVGHDRDGVETDFIANLVRVFAAVGATPSEPGALNLVPVGFVAEACALLGLQPEVGEGRTVFHLGSAAPMSSTDFAQAIAATGRVMKRVPLSVFLDLLTDQLREQRSRELMIFRHILVGSRSKLPIGLPYLDGRAPTFDSTSSLDILRKAGVATPTLDRVALVRSSLRLAASL